MRKFGFAQQRDTLVQPSLRTLALPLLALEVAPLFLRERRLLGSSGGYLVTAPRPLTAAAAAAAAAAEDAPLTQEQWRDFKSKERKSQRAQQTATADATC